MAPTRYRARARARAACVLGLLLVVLVAVPGARADGSGGPGLEWTGPGPRASSEAGGTCADLLFVGARGSGERAPYGDTVTAARAAFAEAAGQREGRRLTAREVWLDFPAVDPHTLSSVGLDRLLLAADRPPAAYFDSVATGTEQLAGVLDDSARRCPSERWVLVGFSQGAEVINRELSRRSDERRLAGVVLVGNPALHPQQQVARLGTAPDSATGLVATLGYVRAAVAGARSGGDDADGVRTMIRALVQVGVGETDPERLRVAARADDLDLPASPVVFSVCDAEDLVCDAGPSLLRMATGQAGLEQEFERTRSIHGGYTQDDLSEPARAVVAELPERLPPPTPVETVPSLEAEEAGPLVLGSAAALLLALTAGAVWWRARRRRRRAP